MPTTPRPQPGIGEFGMLEGRSFKSLRGAGADESLTDIEPERKRKWISD